MPDTNIWLHDLTMINGELNGDLIDVPGGNLNLFERFKTIRIEGWWKCNKATL
jgi:hypothetical protein